MGRWDGELGWGAGMDGEVGGELGWGAGFGHFPTIFMLTLHVPFVHKPRPGGESWMPRWGFCFRAARLLSFWMRCPLLLPLTCPGSHALHGALCLHHRELSESGEARAGRKSFVVRILISSLDPVSFSLGQLTFSFQMGSVFR